MSARSIGIDEASLESDAASSMKLFPNPAQDFTTLELDVNAGDYTVEVIDLNGRTVLAKSINVADNGVQQIKLNVSALSNGMYVIGVQGKSDSYTRLIIAH